MRSGTFSHPRKPGDWISEASPSLNSGFEWPEQLSALPPNLPSSGRDSLLKRKSTTSCPSSPSDEVGLWPAELGICLGHFFSRTEEKLLLEKPLCPSALHPEGKIKEQTQSDFCNLLSYFFLYLRSVRSTVFGEKKKKIQSGKIKMFTTAFFLLGIISHFKSGNTASASALKDSLFISSSPEFCGFFG